jgi:hypothetical protein
MHDHELPRKVPGTRFNLTYDSRESRMQFGKMKLFCGSASPALGQEIIDNINLHPYYSDLKLGQYERTSMRTSWRRSS